MVDLPAILIADGAGIFLMLIVALNSTSNVRFGLLDEKIYNLMLALTLLECFLEPCTFIVDGRTEPTMMTLNYLLNTALFLFNILFAFVWTVYADYKVYRDPSRLKRVYPLVALPALCVFIGLIVNLFTPIFFSISSTNVYARGPFYLVPFLLTYAYLCFGVVMVYHGKGKQQKYMVLPAALFMVPIFIGSMLQLCFYGLSLVWLGVAIAMTTLYMSVQNEESAVDYLSGLYSRHYFMNYLQTEFRRSSGSRIRAAIMFDIDNFKQINDTCGHKMGDVAIQTFGSLLREHAGQKGRAARYAGDEFIITFTEADSAEVQRVIDDLRHSCDQLNASEKYPFKLHFSSGSTFYRGPDDTVDHFLERMDEAMYSDKRSHFQGNPNLERRASRKEPAATRECSAV